MIDKKFCACCQCPREPSDMKIVVINKRKLWRCTLCIEKRAQAKYVSKLSQEKSNGKAL